jgi:type II secretory pathway component PulJ
MPRGYFPEPSRLSARRNSSFLHRNSQAFTLIEMLTAAVASSLILLAIYGIFVRAVKTRDQASERSRQSGLRMHAASVIRNDLQNAYISGTAGILAATLVGGQSNQKSSFGGYLCFTTTTGKDTPDEMDGDVQQVEYYISDGTGKNSTGAGAAAAGTLVRDITRDLLDSTPTLVHEQTILPNVQSLEVTFYDGQTWQPSWALSGSSGSTSNSLTSSSATTSGTGPIVPEAIRVHLQQSAASQDSPVPPPLDILVPWTADPFKSGTISTSGS